MFGFSTENPRAQRGLQAAALGLGIAFALMSVHGALFWTDGQAYWMAAERLRAGEELYSATISQDAAEVYRYAPWFAYAWIPLTFLPEELVAAAWTVAMVAAWLFPVSAFLGMGWRERAIAFLAAPPLLVAALGGNVQPAVIALLFAGLERRWGPGAIGVAASLKLFPILFVAVYLARRRWVAAAAAVGLGALLWLPALASDVRQYPVETGGALSLLVISPLVYLAATAMAVGWSLRSASWSAASLAVIVASGVRFIPYHLGYLLCARPLPVDTVADVPDLTPTGR
jgi:Glycosyltransferase family 87